MFRTTTIIFINLFHLVPGTQDNMGTEQRQRLQWLGAELVQDAKNKIQQTEGIREEHSMFVSFEVGYVMGQIREKYRTMMELYRISLNKVNQRSFWSSPAISEYRPVHFYFKMELVRLLEMEIDKLIDVLEKMPQSDRYLVGFRAVKDSDSENEQDRKRYRLEEQVKRRYREQYLMRKLGSPAKTTAKKRFLNKWPVEGTWSLERY